MHSPHNTWVLDQQVFLRSGLLLGQNPQTEQIAVKRRHLILTFPRLGAHVQGYSGFGDGSVLPSPWEEGMLCLHLEKGKKSKFPPSSLS